jgi:hypothetical protein
MTSKLRPSESISEFLRGGPNNYAYRVLIGDGRENTMCKVRGINLNYNASKLVHFDVIRDMILRGNKGDEPTLVNGHTEMKIKRKRRGEEPSQLLPNLKTTSAEFRFSRGCV